MRYVYLRPVPKKFFDDFMSYAKGLLNFLLYTTVQSCTQIGRTVCLYTVPDLQEKILLKRAVEWLKVWVWHKIKFGLVLEFKILQYRIDGAEKLGWF